MNVLFVFVSLLSFTLSAYGSTQHVPVLLWSTNNLPSTRSLSVVNSFDELLHDALGSLQPTVVVFLKENLSNEDFTSPTQDGEPPYQEFENLIHKSNVLYLPSVVHPMKAIGLLEADGYERVHYEGEVPIDLKNPTVLMVSLPEASSEEGSSNLNIKLIKDVYGQLVKRYSNVLAVYTGRHSSWVDSTQVLKRDRREEPSTPQEKPVLLMRSDNFVVIAKSISFSDNAAPVAVTGIGSVTLKNTTEEAVTLEATLVPNAKLTFTVKGINQLQWSLSALQLNGVQVFPQDPVWAPSGWSYTCTNNQTYASVKPTHNVTFTGLQIQPNIQGEKFGQAMDCVPYFSSPIWTGIVISFLLLSILSWGLMMLMDINTNDRFDDPKGKTITISATD